MQKSIAYESLLGIDSTKSHLLVMFRNAITHGYQLEHKGNDGKTYRFSLGDHVGWKLWFEERTRNGKKEHDINCWELRERFLKAIEDFHKVLEDRTKSNERLKFTAVLQYLKPYHMTVHPTSAKTSA